MSEQPNVNFKELFESAHKQLVLWRSVAVTTIISAFGGIILLLIDLRGDVSVVEGRVLALEDQVTFTREIITQDYVAYLKRRFAKEFERLGPEVVSKPEEKK